MSEEYVIRPIAHIESDFPDKFGVPRQSGLVPELRARVVFDGEYRNPEALRGIELFSHIWLIWQFSLNLRPDWSPTVRPPRLGGNVRMGVFATRSPFRPNSLGLSCVKLEAVEQTPDKGTVLVVSGADLVDGTPIYDVKPYAPYADCHPEAVGGYAEPKWQRRVEVEIAPEILERVDEGRREALVGILRNDPRPSYQTDPERVYGLDFAGYNVKFSVRDKLLTVHSIERE